MKISLDVESKNPGMHSHFAPTADTHVHISLPSAEIDPRGQSRHSMLPEVDLYLPAAHFVQGSNLVDPGAGEPSRQTQI